jgi:RNA polymerase sigma-70 factor (ECF subfamily)
MLISYIWAIVRDRELVEDTFGDVSVEIARSWESYDRSRPFGPWARGVARRVALANVREQAGKPAVLDRDILESIGSEIDSTGAQERLNRRMEALKACIGKLSRFSRKLVYLRYSANSTYDEIARIVKRSVNALYTAFSRIHRSLRTCIRKKMEER